jgi:hypothetical protein
MNLNGSSVYSPRAREARACPKSTVNGRPSGVTLRKLLPALDLHDKTFGLSARRPCLPTPAAMSRVTYLLELKGFYVLEV